MMFVNYSAEDAQKWVIKKYALLTEQKGNIYDVKLPTYGLIISLDWVGNTIVIWMAIPTEKKDVIAKRRFFVTATGSEFTVEPGAIYHFIGTVPSLSSPGPIWHVFEIFSPVPNKQWSAVMPHEWKNYVSTVY